jgi:ATP-dependent RNA helicase UAP56/SUB2
MGKTAVFIISILQQMEEDPKPNTALILCNVRELAYQIKKEVIRFTKHMPNIRSHVFFGGVPIKEDIAVLEGKESPHIVIGTPGRVLQLVNQGHMKLNDLRFFILDECDKMLVEADMRA